ncbi:MAG: hypothetical protein DDT19_00055 [Syntrophomonadaceae bacterium]|nr:hypothetical protein [Bacillota bacterium]
MDEKIINKISYNLDRIEAWVKETQQILIALSLGDSPTEVKKQIKKEVRENDFRT